MNDIRLKYLKLKLIDLICELAFYMLIWHV